MADDRENTVGDARSSESQTHESRTQESQTQDSMDRTRMDISVEGGVGQATHTEIRIQQPVNDTLAQELKPKKSLFSFFKKFIPKKRPKKSSSSFLQQGFSSRLFPFINIWIAPPDLGFFQKILFYVSRLGMLVMGLAGLVALVQTFSFSFQQGQVYRWILLGGLVFALGSVVLTFVFRWQAVVVGVAPLGVMLVLLQVHLLFFSSTDTSFFPLLGRAPATLLNSFWIFFLLFEILIIIALVPGGILARLPLLLFSLWSLSGFVANIFENNPLESSWMGSLVFRHLPWVYAQPVYQTFHGFIPLMMGVSLGSLLLGGPALKRYRGYAWMGLNTMLLLPALTVGFTLFYLHRVPSLLSVWVSAPLGIGVAQTNEQGVLLEVKTKNYDSYQNRDAVERYKLELVHGTKKTNSTTSHEEWLLKAYDASGFPLLFLEKSDFIFSANNEKVPVWSFSALAADSDVFSDTTQADPPLYRLNFQKVKPKIRFSFKKKEGDYLPTDFLEWSADPGSPPIVGYEAVADGKTLK